MPRSRFTHLYTLPPEITAKALTGRKLFRIHCCGFLMRQIDLHGIQSTPDRPFGVSQVTLECMVCHHKIGLEVLTNTNVRRQEILKHTLLGYQQKPYPTQVRRGRKDNPFPPWTRE